MIRIPEFRYHGGKARIAPELVAMMPRNGRVYCEPFAGLGNVYFRAVQALEFESWWLNDIRTWEFFEAVKRVGHRFKMPYSSNLGVLYDDNKEIYFSKNRTDESKIVQHYLCFNGSFYCESGSRSDFYYHGVSAFGWHMNIKNASHLMYVTDAKLTANDYTKVLAELGAKDFAFVDCPYLDSDVGGYSPEDLIYDDLFYLLRHAKFRWMLTHYPNQRFEKAFGKPNYTIPVKRWGALRCATGRADPDRIECVWVGNYVPTIKQEDLLARATGA